MKRPKRQDLPKCDSVFVLHREDGTGGGRIRFVASIGEALLYSGESRNNVDFIPWSKVKRLEPVTDTGQRSGSRWDN